MKYNVYPDYWEACAGLSPVVPNIEAETPEEAVKKAQPFPWNHTFGGRAVKVENDS